jgi:antirestriction protein ArdC
MSKKIYDMITNKIIEKLEAGTVPWRQPFVNGIAVNWKTQKPYRGINTMLLDGGEYATFNQIKEAGGNVKKGEKSHIVVFWKWLEKEDEESGEIENIPYLRYYRVFEVGSQVEGLEPKRKERAYQHDPIQEAEKIKEQYVNAPSYSYISGSAYYKPFQDHINVPPKEDFRSIHEYYSTLFHELIHSTGHKDRLNRSGITAYNGFGSESYSKEELIAELGASMLCGIAGIDNHTLDNSASYIQSWLRALKNDRTLIISASQQAQKAVDYIHPV